MLTRVVILTGHGFSAMASPFRAGLVALALVTSARADDPPSFNKLVRPILQANCFGCHQPAKAGGGYVMTAFDRLLAGGDSGEPAVAPGKADGSELLARIKGVDGKQQMPPGNARKLTDDEVAVLERWIRAGAVDDSPGNARARFDPDHPPTYTRPPVIPSLDVSPDGRLIAVAGFHEVLLHKADGSGLEARLVGLSERIESVRFSPDGKRLAVSGGLPARMGELQVWDVEKRKLKLSLPITGDTIYGVNWSPDSRLIAFGTGEGNTLRAVEADTGKQVLFQGAHSDWVLGTVFSADGSHLVSVSRDRSCKLTEVATQRFVDNVTSITPGALKGGMLAVARHPHRDEIVVGGADGQPKVYRMHRQSVRVIGDDGNLIRELPALAGRVWSVAVSRDGLRIVAGSSLDNAGELGVYGYELDTSLPERIKKINEKVVTSRSPQEREELAKYHSDGVKQVARANAPAGVFAVAFFPDGGRFAAAGGDGVVRIFETESAKFEREWPAAPVTATAEASARRGFTLPESGPTRAERAAVANDAALPALSALEVLPRAVQLDSQYAYAQLIVTGVTPAGERIDVTRHAKFDVPTELLRVTEAGLVTPSADGGGTLTVSLDAAQATVPVSVTGTAVEYHPDYVRDVAPVLSRLGCTAGTCHGSKDGKNGFKLSLRGYDPLNDVRAFTDDHAARRTSVASPDDSLMLLKCTGAVPHVGGQLTRPGEPYYQLIRDWIADGAKLNAKSPRVAKIEICPVDPVVEKVGGRQQFRVVATYTDGLQRDVTREAFVESGNTEVVKAEKHGLTTALRRGEAPILARFEGAYAATTMTVMGDRTGFVWQDPQKFNAIDEFTAAKWKRLKIQPADLCTDAEFMRRVCLDLTGVPPAADAVRAFLADARPAQVKREELIDRLVGSPEYVEYWTNKWADLLQVNRKFLAPEGAAAFRRWIRTQVADNTPYDRFATAVLTASGSNRTNPAASYYKVLRQPAETMENTTHLFLGVRFNCNKCHDHPFERWTQDQYYQTAAFFAQFSLKRDPASGDRRVGGTEVEAATPLYEEVFDAGQGEITHDRTGAVTAPAFPFPCEHSCRANASRRQKLAAWMTSPDNPYFARSYVNRVWGYLFGIGIIEPIDDIRAGNPPTNPALLDYLTQEFIQSGFNTRQLHRLVCKSRTYQLSVVTSKWNEDDRTNHSHALARRLPAEVIFDAVHAVTGSLTKIPGLPPGTRAAELPDSGIELPGGFLQTLGRPARESACECERTNSLQLGPVMALVSGQVLNEAIGDPNNAIAKLVEAETDDGKLVQELFLRVLNRPAKPNEINESLKLMQLIEEDHRRLLSARDAKEKEWAPVFVRLQEDRDVAIETARKALEDYRTTVYEPERKRLEAERLQRVAAAESVLKEYDAKSAEHFAAWEKLHARQPEWIVLKPRSVKGNRKDMTFKVEPDGSVLVEGGKDATQYAFVAETALSGITAVRIEALADERLPGRGPGRAANGNFVLSELEITAAAVGKPSAVQKLTARNAVADFNQNGFSFEEAFNGVTGDNGDGWAVVPRTGEDHWATFELNEPLGNDGGTVLTLKLMQNYSDKLHSLGRFRISVTTAKTPVGLSLPDHVVQALRRAADERSEGERELLMAYYGRTDARRQKLVAGVAEANRPVPPDVRLATLKASLAAAEKPVPIDPMLLQLRADAKLSAEQLKNKRLTAAQDITWALVNSPAFLFNR